MGNTALFGSSFALGTLLIFLTVIPDESPSKLAGITNLGNTCFLNALLQALSSCKQFMQMLHSLNPKKGNTESQTVISLKDLLNSLITESSPATPLKLIESLSEKFPYFGTQHDSHEIYCVILQIIEKVRRNCENSYFAQKIPNPLLAIFQTEITCSACQFKVFRLQSTYDISLELSPSIYESFGLFSRYQNVESFTCNSCSISESLRILNNRPGTQKQKEILLKYLKEPDRIQDADLVCKIKNSVVISNRIVRFPPVLIIHFKLLLYQAGRLFKQSQKMSFPDCLELPAESRSVQYRLQAVIEHLGSSYGGHYIAYKLHEGSWFRCSDVDIVQVPLAFVMRAQPYMLFYTK